MSLISMISRRSRNGFHDFVDLMNFSQMGFLFPSSLCFCVCSDPMWFILRSIKWDLFYDDFCVLPNYCLIQNMRRFCDYLIIFQIGVVFLF